MKIALDGILIFLIFMIFIGAVCVATYKKVANIEKGMKMLIEKKVE